MNFAEGDKALVLRYVHEFAEGQLEVGHEIFSTDFVIHTPVGDRDANSYIENVRSLLATFPDWHAELRTLVSEGDCVIDRVRITATHAGGSAPTGEKFNDVEAVHVWRASAGKLVELDIYGSPTFFRMIALPR